MNKTIFNVYVVMESQEQCDRMKQLCVDNGLPISNEYDGFEFERYYIYFHYGSCANIFSVYTWFDSFEEVTEQEFIELLKEHKNAK